MLEGTGCLLYVLFTTVPLENILIAPEIFVKWMIIFIFIDEICISDNASSFHQIFAQTIVRTTGMVEQS